VNFVSETAQLELMWTSVRPCPQAMAGAYYNWGGNSNGDYTVDVFMEQVGD